MLLIDAKQLTKIYESHTTQQEFGIRSLSFAVQAGDFIALRGPSGSGKSTLLNILGTIDNPTSGSYLFDGEEVARFTALQAAKFRLRHIGFIFQSFHLLKQRSLIDNVCLPMLYLGATLKTAELKATAILQRVELGDHLAKPASHLSRGQQQRVAIARALINEPELILADEPTGNLDEANSLNILNFLQHINRELGTTIIMASHDDIVDRFANRLFYLKNGTLQ